MPAPTPSEIRRVIVSLIKQGLLSREEIAAAVEVNVSTVHSIWSLYKKTGSYEPKPHRGGNPGWFLEEDYPLLQKFVNENNDATLKELADRFEKETGDRPAISTLDSALNKLNLTRKKKRKSPRNETETT